MNNKIARGIIAVCLFFVLLHSVIPVSHAAEVESTSAIDETESTEVLENQDNLEKQKDMETKESFKSERGNLEEESQSNESISSMSDDGLLNVSVLENTRLDATLNETGNEISLEFTGRTLLELSLIKGLYVTFVLPEEIDVSLLDVNNLSATYWDYLIVIPIKRQYRDTFIINEELNSITLNFMSILGLDVAGLFPHKSTLRIRSNQPFTSSSGGLTFKAIGTDGALVNLSVLEGEGVTTATIQDVPLTPSPPSLLPVYSNTTVIRGTLPEDFQINSVVNLYLPDGTQHKATVNDRKFELSLNNPLDEGSIVEADIVTADGLVSPKHSVKVSRAPTLLKIPKTLDFGTVTIGSDISYKFLEAPLEIIVQDTRGINEQWQLQAHIDQPLTTESGHTLPNALGFYEGKEFKPFTTDPSETKGDAITIETGVTQNDEEMIFSWDPQHEEGPAIKIDHSAVYAEPYSTDITWTLVNSVQ